jgi:hypothetical protein
MSMNRKQLNNFREAIRRSLMNENAPPGPGLPPLPPPPQPKPQFPPGSPPPGLPGPGPRPFNYYGDYYGYY